jgi:hypothetical protein
MMCIFQNPLRGPAMLGVVLIIIAGSGCSKGPAFGELSGQVTLDGKSLTHGTIRFMPVDGNTATAGASISDGRYDAKVMVNSCKVSISAPSSTPSANASDPETAKGVIVLPVNLVPPQYNVKTELLVDVKEGKATQDFHLRSK